MASGAANDSGAGPWCTGGGRSPKWPESDDDDDVAPGACVAIRSNAAEDDPETGDPGACVKIRFAALRTDSGNDTRLNQYIHPFNRDND